MCCLSGSSQSAVVLSIGAGVNLEQMPAVMSYTVGKGTGYDFRCPHLYL